MCGLVTQARRGRLRCWIRRIGRMARRGWWWGHRFDSRVESAFNPQARLTLCSCCVITFILYVRVSVYRFRARTYLHVLVHSSDILGLVPAIIDGERYEQREKERVRLRKKRDSMLNIAKSTLKTQLRESPAMRAQQLRDQLIEKPRLLPEGWPSRIIMHSLMPTSTTSARCANLIARSATDDKHFVPLIIHHWFRTVKKLIPVQIFKPLQSMDLAVKIVARLLYDFHESFESRFRRDQDLPTLIWINFK